MRINGARLGGVALLALLDVVGSPMPARAQGIGFVTAGASLANLPSYNTALQVGGGAEVLSGPLGIGGAIDYVYVREVTLTDSQSRGDHVAVLSGRATYNLGGIVIARKKRPFVTGGMGFFLDEETLPMLDVGGGLDWWVKRRTGVRFEVQARLPVMVGVRFGLVFR